MSQNTTLKRWLAAGLTALAFGAVFGFVALSPKGQQPLTQAAQLTPPKLGDWTMFGGSVARNFVNLTAKGLPAEFDVDKNTNILWAADLGSKAYGGPIVANGRIFIGTNNLKPRNPKDVDAKGVPIDLGVLMCFEEKTGKFLWQTTFKKLESGQVNDWPKEGICSTPTVEGDLLYYISNRCEVVCANAKDGSFVWKVDMIKDHSVFPHNLSVCSPLIVGDDVYVVTANGVDEGHINVPAPKAPSFMRLNKKTGKVTWTDNSPTISLTTAPEGENEEFFKKLINRGMLIQHGQWSNPAYGVVDGQPQVIFPGGEGVIYSFDPATNKLLWKFDCNPKDALYQLGSKGNRSDFIATPVVYKNRLYIGVGQDPEHEVGVGHFWCIDMTKRGDVSSELVVSYEKWPPKTKPNPNSAAVWHYGGPTSKADRQKLNRNYYFGRTMSTASIHDGLCYVSDLDGMVHCLDADTGKSYWEHDTANMSWSSTYLADGKLYHGNDGGILTVFKHGKTKEILAEIDVGAKVRATPVAANNVLYVMSENKLYAIAEKK
jgi:outer membrane protein assembly factor BamB